MSRPDAAQDNSADRGGRESPLIEMHGISKHYGHVAALSDVDFCIYRNEIVGLVGDNGAGKSTLVKILSGAIRPTSGDILINGKRVALSSPLDSRAYGIETVYQDLALALHLSAAANVFLGRELKRRGFLGWLGWLDGPLMARKAREELAALRIAVGSVDTPCESLSGGQRQAVAVARAVAWARQVILMDEPTAALGVEEQHQVAQLVREIRDRGMSVLLISHNLPQIHNLCERIVVLRHGKVVVNLRRDDVSVEDVILHITGASSAALP
jgi:simple sugar transport system ATP-binding protein